VYEPYLQPARTQFFAKGRNAGAPSKWLEMLHFQAEKAWAIWNIERYPFFVNLFLVNSDSRIIR